MQSPPPDRIDPEPDAPEQHFFVRSSIADARLFLRLTPALERSAGPWRIVLYVHGATFPSALSIAYRFSGKSWRDALNHAGYDVWGLDFLGFGRSDPYPEMDQPADDNPPLGIVDQAAAQLETAVRFILSHHGASSLSIIAHSWGGMVAGRLAGEHPALIDRLVLFAPLACREPSRYLPRPDGPAWRLVSVEDQWNRFIEDVPPDEPPVLSQREFAQWAIEYLASDPNSRTREPPAVKVPTGPFVEILRAWSGDLAYDPGLVRAPVAIIRGAWDGLCTDRDAGWLFDAFHRSSIKRDIKIGRGTHLMHLETMRCALWRESIAFLDGDDVASIPL